MGYSFYIFSKEDNISKDVYLEVINNLSDFNKKGLNSGHPCDIDYDNGIITISGSFGISGKYVEGFVLNLLILFIEKGIIPKVISQDWGYGNNDDWELLESKRKQQ